MEGSSGRPGAPLILEPLAALVSIHPLLGQPFFELKSSPGCELYCIPRWPWDVPCLVDISFPFPSFSV